MLAGVYKNPGKCDTQQYLLTSKAGLGTHGRTLARTHALTPAQIHPLSSLRREMGELNCMMKQSMFHSEVSGILFIYYFFYYLFIYFDNIYRRIHNKLQQPVYLVIFCKTNNMIIIQKKKVDIIYYVRFLM